MLITKFKKDRYITFYIFLRYKKMTNSWPVFFRQFFKKLSRIKFLMTLLWKALGIKKFTYGFLKSSVKKEITTVSFKTVVKFVNDLGQTIYKCKFLDSLEQISRIPIKIRSPTHVNGLLLYLQKNVKYASPFSSFPLLSPFLPCFFFFFFLVLFFTFCNNPHLMIQYCPLLAPPKSNFLGGYPSWYYSCRSTLNCEVLIGSWTSRL